MLAGRKAVGFVHVLKRHHKMEGGDFRSLSDGGAIYPAGYSPGHSSGDEFLQRLEQAEKSSTRKAGRRSSSMDKVVDDMLLDKQMIMMGLRRLVMHCKTQRHQVPQKWLVQIFQTHPRL